MEQKTTRKMSRSTLTRALKVSQMYQKVWQEGMTDVGIHQHHIYPEFGICLRTMQNYLQIPAARELEKLNNEQN